MTEDEAKLRWCPWAKDSEENYGTFNRTGGQRQPKLNADGEMLYTDTKGVEGVRTSFIHGVPICVVSAFTRPAPARACYCLGSGCMAWRPTVGLTYTYEKDGSPTGYCGLVPQSPA